MMTLLLFGLFLLLLAIGTGYALLNWSLKWGKEKPFALRLGAAYFIGIAFFIVSVHTVSTLSKHADWAVWSTLCLALLLCLVSYRCLVGFVRELLSVKSALLVLVAACLLAPVLLFYWLWLADQSVDNAFSSVASLHAVRYAWLSNLIEACNRIPVMGQNTGQSVLSFMGGALTGQAPFAYLYFWLMASVLFVAVFFYGIFSLYEPRKRLALLATILFMFGNAAASFTHVLVIDSGSPFVLSGYTDTLLGIFSALMLIFIYQEMNRRAGRYFSLFVVTAVICASNFFVAAQNLLLLGVLLPLLVFSMWKTERRFTAPVFWLAILVLTALLAIPQGGMLTPKGMQAAVDYQGMMTTAGTAAQAGVQVIPGYPFHFGWAGEWIGGQTTLWRDAKEYLAHFRANLIPIIWVVEQVTVNSIRVLFFPILGLVALFFMMKRAGATGSGSGSDWVPAYRTLFFIGSLVFAVGFLIAYTIFLNGYKWELSRFIIPGMVLGMMGASLYVITLIKQRKLLLAGGIMVLMLFGPVLNLLVTSGVHFRDLKRTNMLEHSIQVVLGSGPVVETAMCSRIP